MSIDERIEAAAWDLDDRTDSELRAVVDGAKECCHAGGHTEIDVDPDENDGHDTAVVPVAGIEPDGDGYTCRWCGAHVDGSPSVRGSFSGLLGVSSGLHAWFSAAARDAVNPSAVAAARLIADRAAARNALESSDPDMFLQARFDLAYR